MLNTHESVFTLLSRDCDLTGKWRPSAILESLQEVSAAHCNLLGCGRDDLLKLNGSVWVLTRMELHMTRYPAVGETVTVSTFPMPVRRWFFPRYYVITDTSGEMIGKAGSLWVIMDVQTRKMLPPGDVARLIPDNRNLSVPMNLPAVVGVVQGEEFVSSFQPVYTDLDMNCHVNNTRYADWLCNSLGVEMMTRFEPESMVLNYNHEVLPNQTVTLHRILKDSRYQFIGCVGDITAFEIGGFLRPRT